MKELWFILWKFFQFGKKSNDVLKPKTMSSNRKIFQNGKINRKLTGPTDYK